MGGVFVEKLFARSACLLISIIFCANASFSLAVGNDDGVMVKGGKLTFKLKDAEIKSILQIFAKQLGKNIVAGEGVGGKVTLSFTNVKPQEGLDAVLKARGYDWYLEGDTIIVSKQKAVRTYLLQYANAKEVKSALDLLMAENDQVSVNESYNALIVKTTTDNMPRIEKAIRDMDVPPIQVMVEARVLEINRGDGGTLGLDAKYNYKTNPNDIVQTKGLAVRPTDTSAAGLFAQIISGNVEAYLSAMLNKLNYDIVASPRIATVNHKPAYILIGSKLGYRTSIISQTSTVQQVNFLETGTKLTITPHVSDDGFIRMTIAPKISDGYVKDDLPTENTTETLNDVLVKDGQTIIIGGLTKNSQNQTEIGVPFLMNIPIIGGIFRQTKTDNSKRELIVTITPKIMTPEYLKECQAEINSITKRQEEWRSTLVH